MILINRNETDPFFNIAAEEYVLKNYREDVFMLWVNRPAVIIGKHQVASAEANILYAIGNDIPVIRRISGGGTVYHDEGNLNYSLILNGKQGALVDYKKYSGLIFRALQKLSLKAEMLGKSNLAIDGRKFSGNAEHVFRKRVLHHGTLLFNSNLERLRKCIRPAHRDYEDRSIRSTDSRILNLSELAKNVSMNDFRELLIQQASEDHPDLKEGEFSPADRKAIQHLAAEKYNSINWNFGYSPAYSLSRKFTFMNRSMEVSMHCKNGRIRETKFSENGRPLWGELAEKLTNTWHHPRYVRDVVLNANFAKPGQEKAINQLLQGLF